MSSPSKRQQTYKCPSCDKEYEGYLSPGAVYNCSCGKGQITNKTMKEATRNDR